ncbi:TetR/AcrR family transcriptional regulator [Metabacillus niabensis]|uniref:TetR/AcrR family transcriptional regulator n=1 Tax=Metabacillus niabensis TaxID=324854 RepID=UPI001CFAF4C4|nr:TetR/AcrR family transcriptional regulator [Metabacillus niabensis]
MYEKNSSIDRRILKSQQALKKSLLSLMQQKALKEITIKDIVEGADLNRGTFYKHYQYKEDLLDDIMEDVIADLKYSFREPYKDKETFEIENLTVASIKIFEHVEKNKEFYSLMLKSNVLSGFQTRVCDVLNDLALQDLQALLPDSNVNRELQVTYHSYAILGMITEWIKDGFKYSSTYLAEQLLEILRYNKVDTVFKLSVNEENK